LHNVLSMISNFSSLHTFFSTESWYTYGYQLCSSSRLFVPLFVRGGLHTGKFRERRIGGSPNWKFTKGKLKSSLLSWSFYLTVPSMWISRCRSRNKMDLAVYVVSIISRSIGLMWSTKLPNYLAEPGVFSTESWYSYGYQLCSSSRLFVPLFVRGGLHTGKFRERRTEGSPSYKGKSEIISFVVKFLSCSALYVNFKM
jgi:hypothetical protein